MHIIFFGPEGSGKGTQAKLLSEKLHVPVLTSGDLVREAAANDPGMIGDACRQALKTGGYVADSEMFVLWKRRLKEQDAQKGWILDGFPRNVKQAKFLDSKIKKYGYGIDAVLHLKISQDESMKRLVKRARPLHPGSKELHDSPERITSRLSVYYKNEPLLLEYYRDGGVLVEINGEQSPEQVFQEILSHVSLS